MNDSSDAKSRSRRCHNLWHVPRSNWMRRESTGAHFTLKLANSGMTSVGRAWFKSPLAHLLPAARDGPKATQNATVEIAQMAS